MQLNRVYDGIKVAGASGAALVVVMFFPWFGRSAEALGREIGRGPNEGRALRGGRRPRHRGTLGHVEGGAGRGPAAQPLINSLRRGDALPEVVGP